MDETTNIANNTILETLSLNPRSSTNSRDQENVQFCCMFCDHTEQEVVKFDNKPILTHLYVEHRLIIADANDIADLKEYLKIWKKEFEG